VACTYSLVWILLRLVVAVLLIVSGTYPVLAVARVLLPAVHLLILSTVTLSGGRARPLLLLLVVPALVVIPVSTGLVLRILLLILIPPCATCARHVPTPARPVTALIVVSAATLVPALTSVEARMCSGISESIELTF